jgi:hypothetical protein
MSRPPRSPDGGLGGQIIIGIARRLPLIIACNIRT